MTNLRWATPDDAEAFASWASANTDIPRGDIDAVADSVCTTLVTEVDGHAELYIPLMWSKERPLLTIGFLGFRPGQDPRTKARALKSMLSGVIRLQEHLGCEVRVVTKAEYPMGKWALKHGFIQKPDGFFLELENINVQ